MKKGLILLLTSLFFYTSQAQGWKEVGSGIDSLKANSYILSIALDNQENIYVGGRFMNADSKYYVAKWNGTTWSELGTGSNALNANGFIYSVATDNAGNVYAAGDFTNASNKHYVAKWDGSTWSEVGGLNAFGASKEGVINTITIDPSGNIYAGGAFFYNGRVSVIKWNGTNWVNTDTNSFLNGYIYILKSDLAGNIYAGGAFTNSSNRKFVAKYNGSSWSEVGASSAYYSTDNIISLAIDQQDNVYAGGYFYVNHTSGTYMPQVVKWDGTTWTVVGTNNVYSQVSNYIRSISVDKTGNIYAGGSFKNANGYSYVSKWSGTTWAELGTGSNALNANSYISAVVAGNSGNIYAAGNFKNAKGYGYVAQWGNNPLVTANSQSKTSSIISIYPNPTGNNATIDLSENGTISIFNFSGELLVAKDLNIGLSSIDLSYLSPGIYTVLFKGQNTSYAPVKLVKE